MNVDEGYRKSIDFKNIKVWSKSEEISTFIGLFIKLSLSRNDHRISKQVVEKKVKC